MRIRKEFNFNQEMENDINMVKQDFVKKFGYNPSNTAIINILLQTYKNTNITIEKKPKTRRGFMIHL